MTEVTTAPRRKLIAEEKATLRESLSALIDKVPACVNSGGVQRTRAWVAANMRARRIVKDARSSRFLLRDHLSRFSAWHGEDPPFDLIEEPTTEGADE